MKILFGFLLFFSILNASQQYKLKTLLEDDGVIWGFEFIDNEKIILTYKNGEVKLFDLQSKALHTVDGFESAIFVEGQGGLLDVAKSPKFKDDTTLYFTYAKRLKEGGATTLASAKFQGGSLKDFTDLIVTNSVEDSGRHFGSRIVFDAKGYLYFSIGDRGQRDQAQDPNNHFGTILQVNLDDFRYKVYSYGHRNPQGLAYDATNNILYANEHGPRGGDEINIIKEGANYGWPVVSLGKEYISRLSVGVKQKEGMVDPIYSYTPSIAPSSLMLYDKNRFSEFRGKLFSTALAGQLVSIVDIHGDEERILTNTYERFRNIKVSDEGDVYLSTDSGKLYKLVKK